MSAPPPRGKAARPGTAQSEVTPAQRVVWQGLVEHWAYLQQTATKHACKLASDTATREDLAGELLQELAAEAVRSAHQYQPERLLRPWLVGVLNNMYLRLRSKRNTEAKRSVSIEDTSEESAAIFDRVCAAVLAAHHAPSAEAKVAAAERCEAALRPLTETQREIVVLAMLYGLNGDEISERFGITATAARQRLHRALDILRKPSPGGPR